MAASGSRRFLYRPHHIPCSLPVLGASFSARRNPGDFQVALRQSSHNCSHTPLELLQSSPEISPYRAPPGAQQVRRASSPCRRAKTRSATAVAVVSVKGG